jgi:hypothetical protein
MASNNIVPSLSDVRTLNNKIVNDVPYTFYRFAVAKNSWFKLLVKIHPSTKYKKGVLKVLSGVDKNPIMPSIKLPNIIFTKNKKAANVKEMELYDNFEICFFSDTSHMIHIYATNLKIQSISVKEVKPLALKKEVDLWKLRRQFDLEFLDYYLGKNFNDFNPPEFIDRFGAEYKLFKNPNFLNTFIQQLDITQSQEAKLTQVEDDTEEVQIAPNKIIYLVQLSCQYENSSYANRTQKLLNEANQIDEKYKFFAVTRYGYPYDREADYYVNKPIINNIDNVPYIKLTNKTDNFNDNNLIEYLKKYIVETIKFSQTYGIKIIHGCNNFYNGIATVYAAKYLGIKSVYEIRSLWEYDNKPDVYESDVIQMRRSMENIVIHKADKIVTPNEDIKKQLIDRGISENKITVIGNGLSTDIDKIDKDTKIQLRNTLNISSWDFTIGYLGHLTDNLSDIFDTIKKMKDLMEVNVGFLVINLGGSSEQLIKNAELNNLSDNLKIIDSIDETKLTRYIDLFNIAFYPNSDQSVLKLMAQGIPIVAYNRIDNLINDDNVIFANYDNIFDIISSIQKDPSSSEQIVTLAKNYINQFHGWKLPAEELIKLHASLLNQEN